MYVFIHFTNSVFSLYFLCILQVHAFQTAYLYKELYKTFAADNTDQPDTTSFLTSEKKTAQEADLQKLAEEKEEVDFLEFTQIVNR